MLTSVCASNIQSLCGCSTDYNFPSSFNELCHFSTVNLKSHISRTGQMLSWDWDTVWQLMVSALYMCVCLCVGVCVWCRLCLADSHAPYGYLFSQPCLEFLSFTGELHSILWTFKCVHTHTHTHTLSLSLAFSARGVAGMNPQVSTM